MPSRLLPHAPPVEPIPPSGNASESRVAQCHRSGNTTSVRRSAKIPVVLAALALFWAGYAYNSSRPADARAYHRTALQVAEAAHDAVRGAWLTGRLQLRDRLISPYRTAAFDEAETTLAGASKQFAEMAPPDDASRRLRDTLSPLVRDAQARLADAAEASDDGTLQAAVDALGS